MPEPPKFVLGGSGLKWCSAVSYFSTLLGSIIGAGRLSFRVRDGSGRFPAAMAAVTLCKFVCAPAGFCYRCIWWWGVVFSRFVVGVVAGLLCCCKFSAG